MRLGWVADEAQGTSGGAELSSAELVAAAPAWAELVECAPGQAADCDGYVVGNCTRYGWELLEVMEGKPVIKLVRDDWQTGDPTLRAWLLNRASCVVFGSPTAREVFPFRVGTRVAYCPPPLDLEPFFALARVAGKRSGVMWAGRLFAHKGLEAAVRWAEEHERPVDFYGDGPDAPREGPFTRRMGQVGHGEMPQVMARYEWLLFLPELFESFGRVVAEGASAGCKLIINDRIGARWWYDWEPAAIGCGAERFWRLAEDVFTQ